jgi:hypothetical protein
MFRKALSCVPIAAALLWTSAAYGQEAYAAEPVNVCRVASWTTGGPCAGEPGPAYSRQGGHLARAIMVFGGAGVQLVPTPPNALRTSAEVPAATVPAFFVQPDPVPVFARPMRRH